MKTKNPVIIDGNLYQLSYCPDSSCRNCAFNGTGKCVLTPRKEGGFTLVCTDIGNRSEDGNFPIWLEVKNGNA